MHGRHSCARELEDTKSKASKDEDDTRSAAIRRRLWPTAIRKSLFCCSTPPRPRVHVESRPSDVVIDDAAYTYPRGRPVDRHCSTESMLHCSYTQTRLYTIYEFGSHLKVFQRSFFLSLLQQHAARRHRPPTVTSSTTLPLPVDGALDNRCARCRCKPK